MTIKITKYRRGGYAYSISLFDKEIPRWIFEFDKFPCKGQGNVHWTVLHFLQYQYKPNKNRWFIQAKKEGENRVWIFKLLA